MTENNDITRLDVQRKVKPKIEDVIPLIVIEDNQKNALDFVAWFRENKMSPGWSGVHNAWNANFKGKTICKISMEKDGRWYVRLYLINIEKYGNSIIREGLQELIKKNLHYCEAYREPCLNPCKHAMKHNRQFFGEELKGICYDKICLGGLLVVFNNPDELVISGAKTLLEMEREARVKI